MRKGLTAGLGLMLLVLLGGTASASHSWGSYHWARTSTSTPLQLDIGSNVNGDYGIHLGAALADWDLADTSEILALTEVPGAGLKNCGAVAGRVEVCNAAYGYRNGGWLGIAQIWTSGDHIVQGVVKLNDTFLLGGGTYDSPAWRRMVTCQEVGHTFGLDHQDEDFYNENLGTCMDYTIDPSTNQTPNAHDYEELALIYDHVDSDGSGGGGGGNCPPKKPGCSGSVVGSAPSFSQASRANGALYVDHLPGGLTLVTHVFWVPGP